MYYVGNQDTDHTEPAKNLVFCMNLHKLEELSLVITGHERWCTGVQLCS